MKTPVWVWLSTIPIVGSLSIIYAGNKVNRFSWINTGIFLTTLNIVLSSTHLLGFVWLGQILVACCLKDKFIEETNHFQKAFFNHREDNLLLPRATEKIDINNCSKDDLVYGLGLPIVYANEIESAHNEGYIFTHIDELVDVVGIPDRYKPTLESLIIFSYDIKKEADFSWRKCNTFTKDELIACNLSSEIATKIIQEREKGGMYKSFPDLRKRTGLPLKKLTALL